MDNRELGSFDELSDEKLIEKIRSGDEHSFEILSRRYAPIIYGKASQFSTNVSLEDKEDLIQEGYIAFLHAVNSYREGNGASFKTYLNRCVQNKLLTVYKSEKRKKNIPKNALVSIDQEQLDLQTSLQNPEQLLIDEECFAALQEKINKSLSSFEQKVLSRYLSGSSYVQTARSLNTTVKAVDNALVRIRKKLRRID